MMSNKKFLKAITADHELDHEDNCGLCEYRRIMIQVANELLVSDRFKRRASGVITVFHNEVAARWQKTKYYELWKKSIETGRDPREAFKEKGWEP